MLLSTFKQSAERLNTQLRDKLDLLTVDRDNWLSTYLDPVVKWASRAGYNPALDSWRLKMFQDHSLETIVAKAKAAEAGNADAINWFASQMGDRYSPEMVNMTGMWAWSRLNAPIDLGFKGRSFYEERRRSVLNDDYYRGGQKQTDVANERFLTERQVIERVNTEDSYIKEGIPDINLFINDMMSMANVKTFNPFEYRNGEYVRKPGSFMEELWRESNNTDASYDQRKAADLTIDLINGDFKLNDIWASMTQAHYDATLTHNFRAAFENLVATFTLPKASQLTVSRGFWDAINPTPEIAAVLKSARLEDSIHISQQVLDPMHINYSNEGFDLYRAAELKTRQALYLSSLYHYAGTKGISIDEVLAGKTAEAKLAKAFAIQQQRAVQGSVNNLSVREGVKKFGPFGMYKGSAMTTAGTTFAQLTEGLKTGNFTPFLSNIGIRAALGGGRVLLSPETHSLLIRAIPMLPVSDEHKAYLTSAVQNSRTTGELDLSALGFKNPAKPASAILDEQLGLNFWGSTSTLGPEIIPGYEMLLGQTPFGLNQSGSNLEAITGDKTDETKIDKGLKVIDTVGRLIPHKFNVAGVKLNVPFLARVGQAVVEQQRPDTIYNSEVMEKPPVAASIFRTILGGFGPSGNSEKLRVAQQDADMKTLRTFVKKEMQEQGLDNPKQYEPSDHIIAMMENYVKLHGKQDFAGVAPEAQYDKVLDRILKPPESETLRHVKLHARRFIDAEAAGQPTGEIMKQMLHLESKLPSYERKRDVYDYLDDAASERQP